MKRNGFTLIEIAIVLVIVGLLLGGLLRGQELINAARVRNLAALLAGVKVAYLGFQDRFRALPGDVPADVANANIPGIPGGCGATNGTPVFCGNGIIDPAENALAWTQLSRANFMTGSFTGAVGAVQATPVTPDSTNTPTNPYGGFMQLATDSGYGDAVSAAPAALLNLKTGGNVPSAVVAEVDRKVDDGVAGTGAFRIAPTWDNAIAGCYNGALGTAALNYVMNLDVKACGGTAIQ